VPTVSAPETRGSLVGMTGLLDTNVALYLLGGRLVQPLPIGSYGVSVIIEMELLTRHRSRPKKKREFASSSESF